MAPDMTMTPSAEQAVARSLTTARTRAEMRVQAILDAASALLEEATEKKDFTVQEVVARAGISLRSFYQYFSGKHELLLALFESSLLASAEALRAMVAEENDPEARLRRFVLEYYRMCRSTVDPQRGKRAPTNLMMVEFAQQLFVGYPAEAAHAFAPLVDLFSELLEQAAVEGVVRPSIAKGPVPGIVLEAVMFHDFSWTIGGPAAAAEGRDPAEVLWELLFLGLHG